MSVLRKEKKSDFTVIDNGIFRDTSLSMKAKGLLCQMLSLPDNWNYSIAGLSTLVNDGESAVRSALKELKEAGYFRREQVRANGKIAKIEYVISEYKNCENLVVENPQQENLKQEKRAQLNTKELNTNQSRTKGIDIRHQIPPKIEMVQAYISEHGYNVDAQSFMDFYDSKGWFVGRNKMKDWQAAVRTWNKNEYSAPKGGRMPPTNSRRELFARLYEEHKDDI